MTSHLVCKDNELAVGEKKSVKIEGEHIIVYRLEDGFYATQARCTHLFKSMVKGKIVDDCKIQCPLHKAQFDIRTGEVAQWANFPPGIQLLNVLRAEKALKTYPVSINEGSVSIQIDSEAGAPELAKD